MENFNFGNDFAIIILVLGYLAMLVYTILPLLLIHFISKELTRKMQNRLRITNNIAAPVIAYQLSWLLITPLVFTITIVVLQNYARWEVGFFFERMMHFDLFTWFLFSFTLWNYDERLSHFRQVRFRKLMLNATLFATIQYILSFLSFTWQGASYEHYQLYFAIFQVQPIIFVVLTIFLVRRNRIEPTPATSSDY